MMEAEMGSEVYFLQRRMRRWEENKNFPLFWLVRAKTRENT